MTFDAAENQTAVGTVTATDSDGDRRYTIAGGADQAAFSIVVASTGVRRSRRRRTSRTRRTPTATREVLVTSGTDARVKTADQPITVTVTAGDVDTDEAPAAAGRAASRRRRGFGDGV